MFRTVLHISDTATDDPVLQSQHADAIEAVSKEYNRNHNIAGVLLQNESCFFHVLEGQINEVEELLEKIESDQRNKNFSLLFDLYSDDRLYDSWEMVETPTAHQIEALNTYLKQNIDAIIMLDEREFDVLDRFVREFF